MDLERTIQYLYEEKAKVERAIASLEELRKSTPLEVSQTPETLSRRGRKSMGAEERQEVSERMRKYWASRRTASAASSQVSETESGA